jgi:hypothetical protein
MFPPKAKSQQPKANGQQPKTTPEKLFFNTS